LEDQGFADLLSAEPERQRIENSFIQRFIKTSKAESAKALALAELTPEQRFSAAFIRMQNPIFTRIAGALERSVPETSGFGRFKGRDQ